jgi:hypothetical protein
LAEKLANEEQDRKPLPGWPGLGESVTSHEERWRHQARILQAIGDQADVENIIQRWNYRHKKFRGQPAASDGSLHELLTLSGSTAGRQSVIMVSRKKAETAGSCPALLPPVEGNAAGTGLEDVLLDCNNADGDVQGRVPDPNPCGSCVYLSLLYLARSGSRHLNSILVNEKLFQKCSFVTIFSLMKTPTFKQFKCKKFYRKKDDFVGTLEVLNI